MVDPEQTSTVRHQPEDRDLAVLVRTVWARRALVLLCILIGVAVAVILLQFRTPIYTAEVTILPQSRGADLSLLGSLAMQSGFPVDIVGDVDEANYGRIVASRRLLKPLLERTWRQRNGQETTLYEVFEVDRDPADPQSVRAAEALMIRILRDRAVTISRDPLSGFIVLQFSVPNEPVMAADLANALARGLEDYNDLHRTNRARDQRQLVENRLVEVRAELRSASDALSDFVASNRRFAESPVLSREHARLLREVRAREYIWEELMRQYEIARIDELQNVVAVEILDEAVPPVVPDRLSLPMAMLVGALLGGVFALLVLVADELRRRLMYDRQVV